MNRPVQVTLDPDDRRQARRRAAELGITLAEYIRRLVRRDLDDWTPEGDTSAIIAVERIAGSDPATHKDQYIGEAVAARFAKTDQTSQ